MKKVLLLLVCLSVSGCSTYRPSTDEVSHDLDNLQFVRKAGICFGVVKFYSYSGYEGISITQVPLEACR